MPASLRLPIVMAGPVALRHFRQGPSHGEVVAAFRQSAYIRLGDDDVVCLCSAKLRAGPLNVHVQAPEALFAGLRPGTPALARAGSLEIGDLRFLAGDQLIQWQPARVMGRNAWCEAGQGLSIMNPGLERFSLSEGFAPLIPRLCTGWRTLQVTGRGGLGMLASAVPQVRGLLAWLDGALGSATGSPPPVAGLVGLGPGLTPSGDDFLCGMLITLHASGRKHLAGRLGKTVMRQAASGTSLISRAHLSCACQGLGSDALHEALAALLVCDAPALERALHSLDRTGHSSGWDGLAGVVACLAVIESGRQPV